MHSVLLLCLISAGAAELGPEVGKPAPPFAIEDSTGKSYRLSDFKGKNVILEFFRSGSW